MCHLQLKTTNRIHLILKSTKEMFFVITFLNYDSRFNHAILERVFKYHTYMNSGGLVAESWLACHMQTLPTPT